MEQRYGNRQSVREHVELWDGERKYGEFETANISSSGIFIEGCQREIGSQRCLTIKFAKNPNLSYQSSRSALVVHRSRTGVGLMCIHHNNM